MPKIFSRRSHLRSLGMRIGMGTELHKVALPFPHDQHRAVSVADDAFSGTANEQMSESRAALSPKHDKVGVVLGRGRDDLVRRRGMIAYDGFGADAGEEFVAPSSELFGRLLARFCLERRVLQHIRLARNRKQLDDMQKKHFRIEL